MPEVNSYARYAGANYPIGSDVLNTAPTYGDTNNTLTGTYDPGGGAGTVPSASDVREGVDVGQTVGNLHVPPPERVEAGYMYDTNRTIPGTLDISGGAVVEQDVYLIRGDDYAGDGAVKWSPESSWPDLTGASVKYGHAGGTFEKSCTVDGDGNVVLVLTKAETAAMRGVYRYDVQATLAGSGNVVTLVAGFTHVDETQTDVPTNVPLQPGYVG